MELKWDPDVTFVHVMLSANRITDFFVLRMEFQGAAYFYFYLYLDSIPLCFIVRQCMVKFWEKRKNLYMTVPRKGT